MEKILQSNNKLNNRQWFIKLSDLINKFTSSDYYIVFLFLIAIINWKFKLIWLIFSVSLLFIILIYFLGISKVKLFPIAMSVIISLRLTNSSSYILPIIIAAFIFILLFIYDLIKDKFKINDGIFIGMILIFIAKTFSLENTPVMVDSIKGLLIWLFYIIVYIYMTNTKDINNNKSYARYYLGKTFVYLSLAIFVEIILYYLENGIGQNVIQFYGSNIINFGWARPNAIATIYLLILPIILYYFTLNQKKYYLLVIIAINLAMLHLMLSRGAYIAMVILVLPLVLKIINDVKRKTNFVITLTYSTIIVLLFVLLIAIPTGYVKEFFDFLSSKGSTPDERSLMSSIGFNVFQRYPLFGGGVNSSIYYLSIATNKSTYDNFILHTLANTGIIGFIAFSYYIIQIVKISLIKDKFNSYILIIVLALIIQGLMETTFYNPLVMILLSFIFPLMTTE